MSEKEKKEKKYTKEYMKMRNINTMRKNLKKREQIKPSIFPLKGEYLMAMLVKEQNRKLLESIAKDKFGNKDEQDLFIETYLKPNYYIPEVVKEHRLEELQSFL
tara:strand:- start:31 stop:342 length:312 start_codon:yes stop_codon:yes gene_type:complete